MAHENQTRVFIGSCILMCALLCTAGEDTWIEVRSPNFTVISDASIKKARQVAKRLEQFRSVFHTAFPKLRMDPGSPLIVYAARNERSLNALIPIEHQQKGAAQPAGIFMAGPERKFVVLRTDVPQDRGYHVIYHEYVHMVMNLNFRNLPLWLSEGLAELFGYTTISDGTSELGRYSPELLQVLKTSSLIPLTTLMAVTEDSPYYRQQDKIRIFYAQSWALAHYLMLGEKQAHLQQLNEFLKLIENGSTQKEAVERVFGNLTVLQRNLENYIRQFSFYYGTIPTRLSVNEDQYEARVLSPAESLASRGEILVYANRPEEAKAMLDHALQLNPQNALADVAMGSLYMTLNSEEQAQKYFAAAADLDSKSYLAQFFAAQLACERNMDYEAAERYLRRALAINSQFAPAYGLLSYVLMMQGGKLPEALELAMQAVQLEPAKLSHRVNACRILIEMERYDEACRLAERILALAQTEAERQQAESLLFVAKGRQRASLEANRRTEVLPEREMMTEETRHSAGGFNRKRQTETTASMQPADRSASENRTGGTGKLKGLVRSVKCEYPAIMDVVLESDGNEYTLRAENYYHVQYRAVGVPAKTQFQPCKELEGKLVEIEFLSVPREEFSGFIKTVAIRK
jgi:tetratricopeptide (TPR) repeat protein